jgi:hypothetical protein
MGFRSSWIKGRQKIEDMYFGKTLPALKGRFNIPVPILEGFVNTLESKIDDQIRVEFKRGRESTLKTAKKLTSAWQKDSASDRGDYDGADLDAKKLAIFSGFGALKLIPTSTPEYRQDLEAIDYYDLIFEPNGGRDLEKHFFKGQINIFKTDKELRDGVEEGIYDKQGVVRLLSPNSNDGVKSVDSDKEAKFNRFAAMGLNPKNYSYIGDNAKNLTEMVLKSDGEDWYILFDYAKQIVVRANKLKEVFSSGLSPYVAWHTDRNPVGFIGRAPVDSVYPVAEAMRILINQNFDNIQKRNWDQVFINAKKIPNLSDLEYRPNGVIRMKLADGENISNAYAQRQTPDTSTITVNMLQFLNSFLGEKTGVTPSSQGNATEDKVGIYYGNIQQAADRFGLLNKFYVQAHTEIARRYKYNLKDHLPSKGFMVKFVGVSGIQEEALLRKELSDDFSVSVTSANTEAKNDEVTRKKQQESLLMIQKDQGLRQEVSSKWLLKEALRLGEYSEDQIKEATSSEEGGDEMLMSEAMRAIEMIIAGEKTKLNQSANTSFIRKIVNYSVENSDELNEETVSKLLAFAQAHLPIAEKNAKLLSPAVPQQPQGQPQNELQPPQAPQQPQIQPNQVPIQ